ncbi:MAG: hypothetical protein ACRDZ8_02535 [Acidimicrobiales bacterium]
MAAIVIQLVFIIHPLIASAAGCGSTDGHGRANAYSGAGDNVGTGVITNTWSSWFLQNYSKDFAVDAAWLANNNNYNDSIEAGISTGETVYGSWASTIYPYYTLNNGQNETDYLTQVFPTNTVIGMDIWQYAPGSGGTNIYVGNNSGVGGYLYLNGSYYVGTPRLNFSQGEVNPGVAPNTMSGGEDGFIGYYLPYQGAQWTLWGFQTECADSPYYIYPYSGSPNDSWISGGP